MARTILRDAVRLEQLATELRALLDAIDNEENVPERYDSTVAGVLADFDAQNLTLAWEIVGRLKRWAQFPKLGERYTRVLPGEEPYNAVTPLASRRADA